MKKIIYTVLLGDYKLNEPKYINKDWSLICFTDKNLVSNNWSIRRIKCDNPKKKSREIKIRFDKFLDSDLCLYLDAKFTIKCDLDNFVEKNLKSDIAVMRHNRRTCAYDEANFCISIRKDYKSVILNQVLSYRNDGFPQNFGLYAPGIMIRKCSYEVIDFMGKWYNEIEKHSYRDIISFSYVLWKTPIKLSVMPFRKTYKEFK